VWKILQALEGCDLEFVDLMRGARTAVETCMGVNADENVLVVTDTGRLGIAPAFAAASRAVGAETSTIIMTPRSRNGEEPPKVVAEAMKGADVLLLVTTKSLSHTEARVGATKIGVRIASMPGITEDMLTIGGMTADFNQVSELARKVTALLAGTRLVRLTNLAGTDLSLSLEGRRPGPPDTGIYRVRGDFGNLPAGEAYIAPVENSVNGVLVVDGSLLSKLVREPVRLTFEKGRLSKVEGGAEARELENLLRELADEGAYRVGELGIGTNPRARVTGRILEDEKALGTVHIALGKNTDFGGANESKIHEDAVILNAALWLDDLPVLQAGRLRV